MSTGAVGDCLWVLMNNGAENYAGGNAVNLFAQARWLWGFHGRQGGGELGQRCPPHSADNTQDFMCSPGDAQKGAGMFKNWTNDFLPIICPVNPYPQMHIEWLSYSMHK